jgi:hypothetical protein
MGVIVAITVGVALAHVTAPRCHDRCDRDGVDPGGVRVGDGRAGAHDCDERGRSGCTPP